LLAARETSGDFYDFIPVSDRNWGIIIADVADKGMGAALFMTLTSTLFRGFAPRHPTLPALTLDAVNERILSDTRGSMFVTAFYGVLEPHIGRLRYANAGHPPPILIKSQRGKPVDRLSLTGMALGVKGEYHWKQKFVTLAPGDVLVLYTDGVTEAQDPQGDLFEMPRLQEVVRRTAGRSAKTILDAILNEVQRFTAGAPGQDDIAIVVIRRKE
jgi:serine phosphatase RsbU (regulator of sigma subunit)